MDVESFNDGILGSIVTQEGEMANVGSAIAFIAETDADLADAQARGSGGGAAPAPAPAAEPPNSVLEQAEPPKPADK